MGLFSAASFSGSNYLNVANYTGNPAAFSVSQWIRPDALQTFSVMFSNYQATGSKGWFTGFGATNNKLRFWLKASTLDQTGTIPNLSWSHAVFTWDGATASIYLNGNTTPDNTMSVNTIYGSVPTNNYIGTLDTTLDFIGRLAGVGYWSKAVSTGEVASLYNGGYGLTSSELSGSLLTSLVSYYDFSDSSSLGTDYSGNGHNYTNTGSVAQQRGPWLAPQVYNGLQRQPRPVLQPRWSLDMARAQTLPYYGGLAPDQAGALDSITGSLPFGVNTYGPCVKPNDSNGQGCINFGSPISHGATQFTLSTLALLDTNTGGGSGLRHLWAEETTTANMRLCMSSGILFFQVGSDGAFPNLNADLMPLNVPVVVTCRLTTAGVRSIWYGPFKIAERTDSGCAYGSGTGSLALGSSAGANSRNWSGQINGGYVSTRAWSDAEIIAVSRDFFAPVRTPQSFVSAPATSHIIGIPFDALNYTSDMTGGFRG